MHGRLTGLYLMHVAEAAAQRRRLFPAAQEMPKAGDNNKDRPAGSAPDDDQWLAIVIRFVAFIGLSLTGLTLLILAVGAAKA